MQVIDSKQFLFAHLIIVLSKPRFHAGCRAMLTWLYTKLSTESVASHRQGRRVRGIWFHGTTLAFSARNLIVFSIVQAAGWPIWPLLICSVTAVALIIERVISLRTRRVAPPGLLDEAIEVCRAGIPARNVIDQLARHSALGEVLASGLRMLHEHPRCSESDLRASMQASGKQVTHQLERYLSALATIASAAPLLGLLGTVVGMIEIFGAQGQAGQGNPAQMAQGISVALYNTAFGLIVAVPALVAWRYFRARVDGLVLALEIAAERFALHLLAQRERQGVGR